MADIRNPCWKKEHTTKTVRSVLNQHHKLMSATACTLLKCKKQCSTKDTQWPGRATICDQHRLTDTASYTLNTRIFFIKNIAIHLTWIMLCERDSATYWHVRYVCKLHIMLLRTYWTALIIKEYAPSSI